MPYVLVEDFKSGIDTRRTAVTSVPGSLFGNDSSGTAGLTNAHITRGGEIEKRKAFKVWATLPDDTFGLAAGGRRVYIFGSLPSGSVDMSGQPAELSYTQLEHKWGQPPTAGAYHMSEVLSVAWFNGKVYVSALFEDGKISHYWGTIADPGVPSSGGSPVNRIVEIFDGRARANSTITGGDETQTTGTAATTSFSVTGGTSLPGNNLRTLRVDGIDILGTPIAHTGNNDTTAANIASTITALTTTPNYSASVVTNTVTLTAGTKGIGSNGLAVEEELEGDFTISSPADFAGGIDNAITDVKMDGKSIIGSPVLWETSHTYTAQKLADEINTTATTPEWEAEVAGTKVVIIATEPGIQNNGLVLAVSKTGDVTSTDDAAAGGGVAVSSAQQGGRYVFSNKYAIHNLEESTWRWCAVNDPGDWTANGTDPELGSGYQILSNHSRNAEELMAMTTYYENVAILAEDCIQLWFFDPDPAKIQMVQVLNNTGTIASKSVVAIGDSDVFYLSRSGIRSLKSRDSSNAGYVSDIGNPIDELLQQAIREDGADGKDACAILDPRSGRYYLAIGLKVYVFSFFPSSNVSAWSVYEPGFVIEDWAFDGQQILCRSGNVIYSLGGENDDQFDDSTVTIQLPFLDATTPATNKMWSGIDAVCESTWTVKVASDPTDIETNEIAATLNKVTYGLGRVGLSTTSTHLALKLENTQEGPAKLGNLAVHYTTNEAG